MRKKRAQIFYIFLALTTAVLFRPNTLFAFGVVDTKTVFESINSDWIVNKVFDSVKVVDSNKIQIKKFNNNHISQQALVFEPVKSVYNQVVESVSKIFWPTQIVATSTKVKNSTTTNQVFNKTVTEKKTNQIYSTAQNNFSYTDELLLLSRRISFLEQAKSFSNTAKSFTTVNNYYNNTYSTGGYSYTIPSNSNANVTTQIAEAIAPLQSSINTLLSATSSSSSVFSTSSARASFSVTGALTYDQGTGIFGFSTSTLSTSDIQEGVNLYFTNTRADTRADLRIASATSTIRQMVSSTATGLTYTAATGVLSLESGYTIPLTASTTEWASKISSQWTTAGSNIYYTSGNVGVGTTNPLAKLEVVGNTYLRSGTVFLDTLRGYANGDITINNGGNSALVTFKNSGNVGIGTTTPGYALTVAGDANVTGALRFGGSAGTSGYVLQSTGSGAQWVATSTLGFSSSPWLLSGSDLSYSSGSVSVGTANTYSGTRFTSFAGTAGSPISGSNDAYRIQTSSYNDGGRATIVWGQDQSNLNLGRFGVEWSNGTAQMNFVWRDLYNSGVGSSELMRLTGAGNLGIGSSTPAAKLGVAGEAYISGTTTVGMLLSGDGSTTGPGISFRADTDTGIYRRASNQMAFSFGGATKGTWDSTGLRIGDSTAPSGYVFQVIGDSAFNGSFTVLGTMAMLTGGTVFQAGGINYLGGTTYFRMSSSPFTTKGEINGNTGTGYLTGSLGIGTTTPAFPLDVYSTVTSTQTYGFLNPSGTTGTSNGTNSYSIRAQGRIIASEFNAVSDGRLKDVQFNIDSEFSLDAIDRLRPVSFTWKNNPSGQPVLGLIAQEVEEVIPNAVSRMNSGVLADQREVSYNQIVAVMIGAIKELKKQVNSIKTSFENITNWFNTEGNRFNVNGMICVDDTCVTKEQFKMLLIRGGDASYYIPVTTSGSSTADGASGEGSTTASSTTPTEVIDTTSGSATTTEQTITEPTSPVEESTTTETQGTSTTEQVIPQ